MNDKWINENSSILPNLICLKKQIEEIDDNIFNNIQKVAIIRVHTLQICMNCGLKLIINFLI